MFFGALNTRGPTRRTHDPLQYRRYGILINRGSVSCPHSPSARRLDFPGRRPHIFENRRGVWWGRGGHVGVCTHNNPRGKHPLEDEGLLLFSKTHCRRLLILNAVVDHRPSWTIGKTERKLHPCREVRHKQAAN